MKARSIATSSMTIGVARRHGLKPAANTSPRAER